MAKTMADVQAAIAQVQSELNAEKTKNDTFIADVLAAINHLEAKIATLIAGGTQDLQPLLDALAPIKQKIADQSVSIDSPDAQVNVEKTS